MNYKKYVSGAATGAAFAVLAVAIPVSANAATAGIAASAGSQMPMSQGQHTGWNGNKGGGMMGMHPAVVGKVASINGTTLTVTQSARPGFGSTTQATAAVTFTIDAGNATVLKNNATSSISNVAIGDTVMVQGTVSGTNVTATTIRDGLGGMRMGMGGAGMENKGGPNGYRESSSTNAMPSPITGNGQPIVAGTISSINGSSLTITNKSNVSYTVDASNAKIVEGQNTVTVSSLSIGDSVIVQGTVSGNSVTASSVIDQKAQMGGQQAGTGSSSTGENPPPHKGILGSIGGFFMHIFGF